jgi:hypothetical protein
MRQLAQTTQRDTRDGTFDSGLHRPAEKEQTGWNATQK